jgi:hypothetical protein
MVALRMHRGTAHTGARPTQGQANMSTRTPRAPPYSERHARVCVSPHDNRAPMCMTCAERECDATVCDTSSTAAVCCECERSRRRARGSRCARAANVNRPERECAPSQPDGARRATRSQLVHRSFTARSPLVHSSWLSRPARATSGLSVPPARPPARLPASRRGWSSRGAARAAARRSARWRAGSDAST